MGTNGDQKRKDEGLERKGISEIKQNALMNYQRELKESKVPAVLSSYMGAGNLPPEYQSIDAYVMGVRRQLMREVGRDLSQLQMILLDGICETLVLSKYMTTYIVSDVSGNVIETNKYGQRYISELVSKGFMSLQTLLDKKVKQFKEITEEEKVSDEHNEYLRAVMGNTAGTTKGKTGR